MRIISGKYKGRILNEFKVKNHSDLRPTTDKNRETLFNILQNSKILKDFKFEIENSVVLDGFCGTGSVGFEALSRGAKFVTFIDSNKNHIEIAKSNAKLLNEIENCEFLCSDIAKVNFKFGLDKQYNFIFLDPPYNSNNLLVDALQNLNNNGLILQNTLIVLEYSSEEKIQMEFEKQFNLEIFDKRKYGKTIFAFLKKL